MTTNGPTFYTVAEVAEILRVDAATVYRSIRADAFPGGPDPEPLRHPSRRRHRDGGGGGEIRWLRRPRPRTHSVRLHRLEQQR